MSLQNPLLAPTTCSDAMYELLKAINREVVNHPRSNWETEERLSLGFPLAVIREFVLEIGLADFENPCVHPTYGTLSVEERVLLYCFMNMKRHFFEMLALFRSLAVRLDALGAGPMLLIDVGCGPVTAALAMSEARPHVPFTYWGVDRARAMLERGQSLWQIAMQRRIINEQSGIRLFRSWEDVPLNEVQPQSRVFLNFSYFFASRSLDDGSLKSLAAFLETLKRNPNTQMLGLFYLNSPYPAANDSWLRFKKMCGFNTETRNVSVSFKTTKDSVESKSEDFACEVIQLKGK